jgi:DNA-binding MarR family transcriptional regulator
VDPLRKQLKDDRLITLLKALEYLRLEIAPDLDHIPLQVVNVFLYVATHDECHKQQVEQTFGLSVAAGSRCTDFLCEKNRLGKPGLGLITKEVDPTNRRRQVLCLTAKGGKAYERILSILNEKPTDYVGGRFGVHP